MHQLAKKTDSYRKLDDCELLAAVFAKPPAEQSEEFKRAFNAFFAKCWLACRVHAQDEYERLMAAIGDRS